MKGLVEVEKTATEEAVVEIAVQNPAVEKLVQGKTIRKIIYKQGKILNIIV